MASAPPLLITSTIAMIAIVMPSRKRAGEVSPPAVDDVRTAVLHLVELAAAFEGRGFPLAHVPGKNANVYRAAGFDINGPAETFDADLACLMDVVHRLLRHRADQRRLQRNGIIEAAAHHFADLYRQFKESAEPDISKLETMLAEASARLGIELTEDDYVALAPDEDDIRAAGGPADAAREALHAAVGLSPRMLSEIKREPRPFDVFRRAFGRAVLRPERAAYAEELHDELLGSTSGARIHWADLKTNGEPAGRVLDRRIEALVPELLRSALWPAVLADRGATLDQLCSDERESIAAAFARAVNVNESGVVSLHAGLVARLPERLRQLADRRLRIDAPDALEVWQADVDRAIAEEAIATVQERLVRGVAEALERLLDPDPDEPPA
jgi:hypothetical protein